MAELMGNATPALFIAAMILMLSVGVMLGMVGGGGSLLAVPILVYLVGLPASAAIAVSLPIVGVTSLFGAVAKAARSEFDYKSFLLFGILGSVGAVVGARLTPLVPEDYLLLLFAAIMIAVALGMWFKKSARELAYDDKFHIAHCSAAALGVGALTGFLGTGGGFLLVPTLQHFARQGIRIAAGTSLGIIALNSAAGFAAHWNEASAMLPLVVTFTLITLIGLGGGVLLSKKIQPRMLEKMFAGVAFGVAIFLIVTNI